MKIFWALILMLVLAAAGVWALRSTGGSKPAEAARETAPPIERPREQTPAPTPPVAADPATREGVKVHADANGGGFVVEGAKPEAPSAPVESTVAAKPEVPAKAATPQADTPATPVDQPAELANKPTSETPPAPVPPTDPILAALGEDLGKVLGGEVSKQTGMPTDPVQKADASKAAVAATPTPAGAAPAPSNPNAPATLVKQADGSMLVDNRFIIAGEGTKADPYRVSWELLMSAQETYQPRLGRKIIPDRVKRLDGKWVTIAGYIAFPIMAQSQDEMLMMLNQWDGCCIGVPPTPYDAIEVRLKDAVLGNDRLRSSGTITGILRVDPYLVKDWLVSLFLLDEGQLSNLAGQQPPPQPGSQRHLQQTQP